MPAVGAAEQFCAAMAPQPQTQISIPELIRLQLAHDTWLAKFALCALLMLPAIHLYKSYGFNEIPAYYHNPISNAVYFEKRIAD